MNRKLHFVFSFIFFLSSIFFLPSAYACPFCKEAIARMGDIWTSIGFNLSIYVMIAIPFLLVGSFVLVLYLNFRRRH